MSLSHMGTVAKIVAASMGVEVVFDASADTASTDGTRIFIPTSLIGNGDAHTATLMRGFIAHEGVGHIRHTDMAAWSAFVRDASPLGKSILNIIEDIRIERLACRVYPGIKRILNETVEALRPEGFGEIGFFRNELLVELPAFRKFMGLEQCFRQTHT